MIPAITLTVLSSASVKMDTESVNHQATSFTMNNITAMMVTSRCVRMLIAEILKVLLKIRTGVSISAAFELILRF
jgi:hypothetical protein